MVPPMSTKFTIPGWRDFQHYKKRNPPWIKLHFAMLSSEDWVSLDDESRVLMMVCMLVASKEDGIIPNNPKYLKRVGYLHTEPNFQPLLDCGFLQVVENIEPHASNIDEDASKVVDDASKNSKMLDQSREEQSKEEQRREEPPASRGEATPKDDWRSKPDPLAPYPKLTGAYPKIHACLEKLHRGVRIPEPGTKSEYDSRMEFARLCRLDNFSEDEILDTLRWVTSEEPQTGGFSWRDQFQSIAALRDISKGTSKFSKMHAAYLRWKGEHSPAALDPEKAAALDRLHAMHQQGTAA